MSEYLSNEMAVPEGLDEGSLVRLLPDQGRVNKKRPSRQGRSDFAIRGSESPTHAPHVGAAMSGSMGPLLHHTVP